MNLPALQKVDHAALKANQLTIILLNLLAFIFNLPLLVAFTAAVMALGVLLKMPGFLLLYRHVYQPLGLLRPDVLDDNPAPHRFAQLVGCLFLAAGYAALFLGAAIPGWALVWLVIALAALNAFGGFCVGCAMYYWLGMLKIPGFTQSAPAGIFPGMKPKRS